MNNFLSFYQHLPEHLNPTAFSLGFFSVQWYSLMYLAAFAAVYFLLKYRVRKKETDFNLDLVWDIIWHSVLGVIIGGRLGYVLFYNLGHFLSHPVEIISPFDQAGNYIGLYGMSYHGGLIGVILAMLILVRKKRITFLKLADFMIPAIPAGYFFGRLGNFLNGELYGRLTKKSWGMYFYDGSVWQLRHPSQLYEAILEGVLLFLVFWTMRNKKWMQGYFLPAYLFGYGFVRLLAEFFREPDPQVGYLFGFLTLGQLFSLAMIVAAGILFLRKNGQWKADFKIDKNNV